MATTRRVWPLPECLPGRRGGRWEIIEGWAPRVDVGGHLMMVPLGNDPIDACHRLHELAHARWSWRHPPQGKVRRGTHDDTLQAVEDARMHLRLARCGVDLSAGFLKPNDHQKLRDILAAKPFRVRATTLMLLSTSGTGTHQTMSALCRAEYLEARKTGDAHRRRGVSEALSIAARALRMLNECTRPTTLDTLRIARWVEENLLDKTPSLDGLGGLLDWGKDMGEGGHVPWGELKIHEPPLTVPIRGGSVRYRWRSTESGTIPRRWHRWVIDQAVFAHRTPLPRSGTVLVDLSASMALSGQSLLRLVKAVPDALVAAYSGQDSSGVLRVLVRQGRRVPDHLLGPPAGGMNVVDKPALEWLARQPGPRVWVSDGNVTGIGDRSSAWNVAECEAVCRQARIRRVASLADAPRALAQAR